VGLFSIGRYFSRPVKVLLPIGRILQGRNSIQILCPLCKRYQPSLTSLGLVIAYDPRAVRGAIWTCEQCHQRFRLM
jgi:hypothetical protein